MLIANKKYDTLFWMWRIPDDKDYFFDSVVGMPFHSPKKNFWVNKVKVYVINE